MSEVVFGFEQNGNDRPKNNIVSKNNGSGRADCPPSISSPSEISLTKTIECCYHRRLCHVHHHHHHYAVFAAVCFSMLGGGEACQPRDLSPMHMEAAAIKTSTTIVVGVVVQHSRTIVIFVMMAEVTAVRARCFLQCKVKWWKRDDNYSYSKFNYPAGAAARPMLMLLRLHPPLLTTSLSLMTRRKSGRSSTNMHTSRKLRHRCKH